MTATAQAKSQAPLTLRAETAADLMAPNPISIRSDASAEEALFFFTEKGVTAAPVIDAAGRPIGVLSRSDLLVHERENLKNRNQQAEFFGSPGLQQESDRPAGGVTVADLMTPALFAVAPNTAACRVVEEMLALNVHRLFVVDPDGVLVGVVSAMDIVKHLQ